VFNASKESNTFYTSFDVSSYNIYSATPRVYKKYVYTRQASPACTLVPSITTIPVWTVIISLERGVPTGISYDEGCFFCASNGVDCVPSAFNVRANASAPDLAADFRASADGGACVSCQTPFAECYPSQANSVTFVRDSTNHSEPGACDPGSPSPTPTVAAASPSATNNNASLGLALAPDAGCDLKVFVVWDGTDAAGNYLKSSNRRFSVYRAFAVASAFQSALNLVQQGFDIGNSVKAIAQGVPGMLTPGENERRLAGGAAPAPAPTASAQPQPPALEAYPGLAAPAGFRESKHNLPSRKR
jgi:hypothetical protein